MFDGRYPSGAPAHYRTQSVDTSIEAEAFLLNHYRQLTPSEKIDISRRLTAAAEDLALAGMRRRYPGASPRELQRRLAELRLGEAAFRAAFGAPESNTTR